MEPPSLDRLTCNPPVEVLEYTQNEMVPTPPVSAGVRASAPVELRIWQEYDPAYFVVPRMTLTKDQEPDPSV
mgnify:CR=1 FL=1